jgi:hypothetical protein
VVNVTEKARPVSNFHAICLLAPLKSGSACQPSYPLAFVAENELEVHANQADGGLEEIELQVLANMRLKTGASAQTSKPHAPIQSAIL